MTQTHEDKIAALVAQKIGNPAWYGWIYEVAPQGGMFVLGAICAPITKGLNKGKPNWRKARAADMQRVYLSPEDLGRVAA